MNFRPRAKDEPEINLIPFIDVLLVILIFLMLTTTYSKFTELKLTLPVADAEQQRDPQRGERLKIIMFREFEQWVVLGAPDCAVLDVQPHHFRHGCDTAAGASGAPLLAQDGSVIGVHVEMLKDGGKASRSDNGRSPLGCRKTILYLQRAEEAGTGEVPISAWDMRMPDRMASIARPWPAACAGH
eukprot:gene45414-56569_t